MNSALRQGLKNLVPRRLLIRDLGPVSRPMLLLTFDDGPTDVTPHVLDRLDAYGACAIFFVVGRRAEQAPALLRAILDRGHRLGNHTYEHPQTGEPSFPAYLRDVRRCQQVVQHHTGSEPSFFRPPRGHLSFASLTVPRLLGLKTMNWSLNVRDWACRTPDEARLAARRLDDQAQPGQIVLLHDDNVCVLEVLDYVLPRLVTRGFDLSTAVNLF